MKLNKINFANKKKTAYHKLLKIYKNSYILLVWRISKYFFFLIPRGCEIKCKIIGNHKWIAIIEIFFIISLNYYKDTIFHIPHPFFSIVLCSWKWLISKYPESNSILIGFLNVKPLILVLRKSTLSFNPLNQTDPVSLLLGSPGYLYKTRHVAEKLQRIKTI